jgi:hypothetical protein
MAGDCGRHRDGVRRRCRAAATPRFFNARDAAIATLRKTRNEKISKAATIRD